MPDRRFRDMSLTEDEVDFLVAQYVRDRQYNERDVTRALGWEINDRAKRLLPLWRAWGLRELASKASVGETSLGRLEYKGPWAEWLNWFSRAPLAFPADYKIVFRVTQPRKKRGDQ